MGHNDGLNSVTYRSAETFPRSFFPFFILQTTSDFSSKFIIVVIKEAESSLFSQRAANILPPINTSVSTATWSRPCRANTSAAGRKVAGCGGEWWGNGAGTFFQGANYTLVGTDGSIPLGLCLQLKAAFVAV